MKNLIGKKVRGFKFDSRDHCVWFVTLEEYIGRVGVVDEYLDMVNVCVVKYGEDCLLYPAELIEQHIVEESDTLTPRGKAKELVDKYEKYLFGRFTTDGDWVKCVECALIAVDEILILITAMDGTEYWQEYYEQVRTEIDKL